MGLNYALVDAASGSIQTGQMHQCRRVYLLRRFAKPLCRGFEVLRYTLPDRIKKAEIVLRSCIAVFCQAFVYVGRQLKFA